MPETDLNITAWNFAKILPRSSLFAVTVDGVELDVMDTGIDDFAAFEMHGPVQVEVRCAEPLSELACVRPMSRGIEASAEGDILRFTLTEPANLCVHASDPHQQNRVLFLYANPPEADRPDPEDPAVHYFCGGQVHEVGCLELSTSETLYLEGGAWVRGAIRARDAADVTICGPGVFDGNYYPRGTEHRQLCHLTGCRGVQVRDAVFTHFGTWTLVLSDCEDVHVQNLKEITATGGSDGIDVVSCREVLIEDCCLRNGDDCVVIKAVDHTKAPEERRTAVAPDVENVLVRRCVLLNSGGGSALEIGHEVRCRHVRNITFRDCDILGVHGHGAAFSINNGERAVVSDVLYQDIRVEHHYDLMLSFRVMQSRYTHCPERGHVRNVHLKNIRVGESPFNPGYSMSVIGGVDAEHTVDGVVLEDVYFNDRKITAPEEMDLFMLHAKNIEFK